MGSRWSWLPAIGLVCLLAGAACSPAPRPRPSIVGVADLIPAQEALSVPPFPSAETLPRLTRGTVVPGGTALGRPPYRVGPLDQLTVLVWGRTDLGSQIPSGPDGRFRASVVRENGMLYLPFLAPLTVSGKSLEEIRTLVQASYAAIIENPQVDVALLQCASQSVQIGGAATAPGTYYLCDGRATLGEVLTGARGLTATADLARGVLTRDGLAYRLDYREGEQGKSAATDILLQAGDTIYFPPLDERLIYVFGEVKRQGAFPIPAQGMSLLDALGQAQGIDTTAFDSGGVFLMRRKATEIAAYRLTFEDILQSPAIPLAAGDRIFVATSGLERWTRFWTRAFPFLRIYVNRGEGTFLQF